jgi:hypothetical protein
LAAEDGYVSRVKISLGGYGNALYITHPNGYTTVYGHLQKFNEVITSHVLTEQYAKKMFTVELYFTPDQIPVKRGEVVALSGNTGGSGGPHLHFEIRTTKNLVPQNPLKFGFDIQDDIKPIIKNLAIYPMNDTSIVNGKPEMSIFPVVKSGNSYVLSNSPQISARGVIGFGVEAIDNLNGSSNRCGVYSISLQADTTEIYSHQMDEIGFDETRFIQTHVDFYQTSKYKRRIQKSYLTSYNKLKIYHNVQNKGLVYFSKFGHDLKYTIKDVYGNESNLNFSVLLDTVSTTPEITYDSLPFIAYDQPYTFENSDIRIHFPAFCLYDNLHFSYRKGDTLKNGIAPIHHIQDLYTALEKYITISIRADGVPTQLENKLYAVSLNSKNEMISPEGGSFENGWVTFSTRSLGPYTILVDENPPTIEPVNFKTSEPQISHLSKLELRGTDVGSGIKTYNAFVNGRWTLLEFDKKSGSLWIDFSKFQPDKGNHQLVVQLGDAVNNIKTFSFDFIW